MPGFIAAQIVGALIGLALIAALYPDAAETAGDVVIPHHETHLITPINGAVMTDSPVLSQHITTPICPSISARTADRGDPVAHRVRRSLRR